MTSTNHAQSQTGYLNTEMALERAINIWPLNTFTSSEIRKEVEHVLGRSVPANTIRAYIYKLRKNNVIRSADTIDSHSPF